MVRNSDPGMHAVPITAADQIVQRTIPLLERDVDNAIGTKPLAIDLVLAPVQIIDSAGLNWLIGLQNRLESLGMRLRIMDPSPVVSDIFLATRLAARFTIHNTATETGGPVGGRGDADGGG